MSLRTPLSVPEFGTPVPPPSDDTAETAESENSDVDVRSSSSCSSDVEDLDDVQQPSGSSKRTSPNFTTMKMAPVARLPPELLSVVFSYLDSKRDQWAFIMTCRSWFSSSIEGIWFRPTLNSQRALFLFIRTLITVKNFREAAVALPPTKEGPRLIAPYGSFVKRLNLSNVSTLIKDSVLTDMLVCDRLERLTLGNCDKLTDRSVKPLITMNRFIQSVDISNLEFLSDETLFAIAQNCPNLQGLYASGCKQFTDLGLIEVAKSCSLLKRVKLNGCVNISDEGLLTLVQNCPFIVELDVAGCAGVTNSSMTPLLMSLRQLREFRVAANMAISDDAFINLPTISHFEKLRIIDLTSCVLVTDSGIGRLVKYSPRLRNVVLAKCVNITDRGVQYLSSLEQSLHYLHLGHCSNITDRSVNYLVKRCPKIQYIDFACCTQLTNAAVKDLSTLAKLRRIGLVKCQNITDTAIYALAKRQGSENTLERIHLSYCGNITLFAIMQLVNSCQRLTHLSLTGVPPFMRPDLTRYCREPPPEFTQHQQSVFCVFSGIGVDRLRNHLNGMMAEHHRVTNEQETLMAAPTHELPAPVGLHEGVPLEGGIPFAPPHQMNNRTPPIPGMPHGRIIFPTDEEEEEVPEEYLLV
ncbi:SCF ubiquitin ligase complex subunit GRR1 [Sugiyamaella lignohabitans]|uniref:SCF ubiquitin ligase complex subunit GRR1 n=1 Tax=Sugiyamaella lignohabitans TaxID=796027 RepID=A0A167FYJ8_9ASCO|nr:SCF ubiquitin ligase complex subunit GRR1 [Sugiyamaella lignohabitans]ANB15868.1 SCF ubiquitin ligase complex subunit GRR1 [Sugiyamaella lignohabitans]